MESLPILRPDDKYPGIAGNPSFTTLCKIRITQLSRNRPLESCTVPKMNFIDADGNTKEVDAPLGLSVMEIAHKNKIDLEGACEGALACSTCHVIVEDDFFDQLDEASEDEEDMLDLAFGLTHTSRLGCQIIMTEELDGLKVKLPAATRNMMVDV